MQTNNPLSRLRPRQTGYGVAVIAAAATRPPGRPAGSVAEQTRAELLSSARELFSQYGYHATTFQQVAERAGLTRPAVNYHFRTKRALYQQVTQACYRSVVAPAVGEAVKESTLAQQVSVFLDVAGGAVADDPSAAAFLCTSTAECATWPDLRDPKHDPITTVRAFLASAVDAAEQHGELRVDIEAGPLIESLVAMLCAVWFYVGFLGAKHERATTSTIHQLLTGSLSLISQP
jgi:TetR/AcrR family transcriptional repressor of uid operon